ncbi:winged helix-turn-helix domain-containing protein [Nonomuraea sp. NPDC003804]|uniref:winged helix-turn-helix domain-containing protein n=1 Tax=Nonomuraea sp. NPDC003804 TaxID=3154547 RepID=UPI0033B977E1
MEDAFHISDPRTLKVVAHPLRVRLLGLLRAEGPATASSLARTVGESSGSTSYHLRELAKYGFIEEDPSDDARERRWRARHRFTAWNTAELSDTPEGKEAVAIMHLRQIESIARSMEEFQEGEWPVEWVEAAGMGDRLARLTPEGVKEYFERVADLQRELEARYGAAPGAEQVYLGTTAFPRRSR